MVTSWIFGLKNWKSVTTQCDLTEAEENSMVLEFEEHGGVEMEELASVYDSESHSTKDP